MLCRGKANAHKSTLKSFQRSHSARYSVFLGQHRALSADCTHHNCKTGPWISGASLPYEKESQQKKKCNSTIPSQFLVSCSQTRWAETVTEPTASVLIRTLRYSTKYREQVFLLSLMLQNRECPWYFYCIAGHYGQIEHPTALS